MYLYLYLPYKLKKTNTVKTQLNLTQEEIKSIRKLLLRKQQEQMMNGEFGMFKRSIEMDLYQLFTKNLK